ncbi:M20/M25/M40 family metallo-hydrolase [Azospirillum brasilense]|uniref:M20/M25/M40 family metallo-hydrolase n=1 Tax=Azospirillum brasilense TaxID=192 RepID=A0A4D8QZI2_AZOBR|nr:M20/M25/M40 family metallo-hydrolase [Azospirillum brasilense]QCO14464.1 M20/M25/M40 family metallo-hydrolase [Azospirillum brasilense]
MSSVLSADPVLQQVDRSFEDSLGRLCDLLRIPSVSTDPAYKGDVRRAADWLVRELSGLGFDASVRETAGHPAVVAHHPGPGGSDVPHILYYGHYDVQPAEPLELWNSPPFEPAIVEAEYGRRIVARGAVDDKGQVMTFIEAFRAWHAVHGTLPIRVTVLLEGEEETGSPNLLPFLKANAEELKADVCVITDTNAWNIDTPAITTRLRGLLYVEATLHGPSHDLHSGMFGGAVLNPINALTRILGQIHDEDGRVRFPGFYDDVAEPTDEEKAMWRDLGFDESAFLAGVGLTTPAGEAGRSALERLWSRPTCDINGIWGGYTGEGSKTVIASKASAKLSCRLVPAQDPEKILVGIRSFLEERTPADGRWEIKVFGRSPGVQVPTDSPYLRAAMAGLGDVFANKPALVGSGGSIPVGGYIRQALGFDSIFVGFGLEDDRIHSPNEKFEVKCLHNGIRSHAAMLARFAAL